MWLRLTLLFLVNVGDHRRLPWSPEPDSNRRPRPYQERALPTELSGQTKAQTKIEKNGQRIARKIGRQLDSCKFPKKATDPPKPDRGPGSDAAPAEMFLQG